MTRKKLEKKFHMDFDADYAHFNETIYTLSYYGCCNRMKSYWRGVWEDHIVLELAQEEIGLLAMVIDQLCRAEKLSCKDLFSFLVCKKQFMMPCPTAFPCS